MFDVETKWDDIGKFPKNDKAMRAQQLMEQASDEIQMARDAMERTMRARRGAGILPPAPAYEKIY